MQDVNNYIYEEDLLDGKFDGNGTYVCPNGDTYIGEFRGSKFNGYGTLRYKNGDTYDGGFRDGQFHGTGTYVYSDGTKYIGGFFYGKYRYEGILQYPDGMKYDGEFFNGMYNGDGTLCYADGLEYKGDFKDGKFDGKGILRYADGSEYEGIFKDGKYHGYGTLRYKNGDVKYEGNFEDGMYNGKGTLHCLGGVRCIGIFLNGKQDGYGILYYPDGSEYKGNFLNGEFDGYGTLRDEHDNITYEGYFKDGMYNGKGTYVYSNDTYKGNFQDGKFDGYGTLHYKNGDTYEGNFVNGMRNGDGILRYKNGDTYTGDWKDGKRHGYGTLYCPDGKIKYKGLFDENRVLITKTVNKQKNPNTIMPTLLIASKQVRDGGLLAKTLTKRNVDSNECAVCENAGVALEQVKTFIQKAKDKNSTSIRLMFNQHGRANGGNDLGMGEETMKEIFKACYGAGIKNIIISDLSCHGSLLGPIKEALNDPNSNSALEGLTVKVRSAKTSNTLAALVHNARVGENGKYTDMDKDMAEYTAVTLGGNENGKNEFIKRDVTTFKIGDKGELSTQFEQGKIIEIEDGAQQQKKIDFTNLQTQEQTQTLILQDQTQNQKVQPQKTILQNQQKSNNQVLNI